VTRGNLQVMGKRQVLSSDDKGKKTSQTSNLQE